MATLTSIEGIGEIYAEKLAEARIGSTHSLLKEGATRKGRNTIAKLTGVNRKLVLSWVNKADLFRIRGIGGEYSDLLEAAGVDTVVELATRKAVNLHEKMASLNALSKIVRRCPTLKQVRDWIRQAKKLPRVVEY